MIVHRDYAKSSDSVVKLFDDRIEFYNPGGLLPGLTVKKLLKGNYISNIRNKQIAEIFKETGLIEKYGSGIKRIIDAFKSYGLKQPSFKEYGDGFMVTVYSQHYGALPKRVGERVGEMVGEMVGERVGERVGEKLTPNQLKMMRIIVKEPYISAAKLADRIGISLRKIEENLRKLKQKNVLRRVGADRGGYWEVVTRVKGV
jgi:ATP-dependent DNA helicase RecG